MRRILTDLFFVILGFLIFVALFWFEFFGSFQILFFRGILLDFVSCLLLAIFIVRKVSKERVISIFSLVFAFNLTFLTIFPVTIDRSVTIFLLNKLDKAGNTGLTMDQLKLALNDEYVGKLDAAKRRMDEQAVIGYVEHNGERWTLSNKGERFLEFSRLIARIFKIDQRFVGTKAEEHPQ